MNAKRFFASLLAVATIAIVFLFIPTALASPQLKPSIASITVNTTVDEYDLVPNGSCSLREAIQSANTNANFGGCVAAGPYSDDEITLPTGTYTLTITAAGNENLNAEGDLDISSNLSILGSGLANTVIDGNGSVTGERVLHITGAFTVLINGVKIEKGVNVGAERGAGIRNDGGNVSIAGGSIGNNGGCVSSGGGISNESGTMVIYGSSTIFNNCAGVIGGGIFNGGTMTVTDSSILDNTGPGGGGGINNALGATLRLENTTVTGHTGGGGGILNDGTLSMNGGSLSMNTTSGSGAGLYNTGSSTVSGTLVFSNTSTGGFGGAIYNPSGATLTVTSASIISNVAPNEGGGIHTSGTAVISNTSFMSNSTQFGAGILGGSSGNLSIYGGSFSLNVAGSQGGAINTSAATTLTNVSIHDNSADFGGGGITSGSSGPLTITLSNIYSNTASSSGGGIRKLGSTLSIISSTISTNQLTYSSGQGGAGVHAINSTVSITGSAIISNSIASDTTGGGGILNQSSGGTAAITIVNSTLSGNTANYHGGAIENLQSSGTATASLNNVTISNNTADNNNNASGDGGGIFNSGTFNIKNSIVATNTDKGNQAPDCSGTLVSQGNNLLGKSDGCTGLTNGVNGDLVGTIAAPVNPLLGSLANNGGSTQTHALLTGSPALDAGNAAAPGSGGNACLSIDQRGITRPFGVRCDIGAFEFSNAILYLPLVLR